MVKSIYTLGSGMGLLSGGNAALTNASLVELGKQLLSAARDGDKTEVSRLLAKGAPMTTDWLGTSPLHLAAQYGHLDIAEILLRSGCQRDARTKVEKTPLHVAAQEGHDNVAELLLSNGADVDTTDMVFNYLWQKYLKHSKLRYSSLHFRPRTARCCDFKLF